MKTMLLRAGSLLAVLAVLAGTPHATAVSITNATGGDFTNSAIWVGGVVPATADTIIFTNPGTYTISMSTDRTNAHVLFPANTFGGVVTLDLGTSKWTVTNSFLLGSASASTNNVILSSGTLLVTNLFAGDFRVGYSANGNVFSVTNSATLMVKGGTVGSSRSGNQLVVAGTSAQLINIGTFSVGGGGGAMGNSVRVGPGGTFSNSSLVRLGSASGDNSNLFVVAGANARLTGAAGLVVGASASAHGNALVVSNGGYAWQGSGYTIGSAGGTTGSLALVTGSNSWMGAGGDILFNGWGGRLVVSNGGTVQASADVKLSILAPSSNALVVTGLGSILQFSSAANGLRVGSNAFGLGQGAAYVLDRGTLRTSRIIAGSNGTGRVINDGGIYEFSTNAPIVDLSGTAGAITLNNGTVSFRNVNGADLAGQVTNISYSGANTLRLDGATNAALSASSFTNGGSFSQLQLANTNAMWNGGAGGSLTIGTGGSMLVSNAVGAVVSGTFTNTGAVTVYNSSLSFKGGPVVISGGLFTDPSTVTFESNVTVTADGFINATNDTFVFYRNLVNQSTNQPMFNLSQATVQFVSNGGATAHLYDVSGSGSRNIGQGFTNFSQVATNFAIGALSIQAGNRLTITGSVDTITNAVYVGWLDIQGLGSGSLLTNNYTDVTNTLVLALSLPNINLYYDKYDTRNDWLTTYLPNTGYDLWNGGLLLPIPEPSALAAALAGLGLLAFLRRRA